MSKCKQKNTTTKYKIIKESLDNARTELIKSRYEIEFLEKFIEENNNDSKESKIKSDSKLIGGLSCTALVDTLKRSLVKEKEMFNYWAARLKFFKEKRESEDKRCCLIDADNNVPIPSCDVDYQPTDEEKKRMDEALMKDYEKLPSKLILEER